MTVHLRSLYLCVEDMDRAIRFYEKLLERPVTERDSVYSVFDISGFRLGLFAYRVQGEEHSYGSNCLPSLEMENVEALERKLAGREQIFPLQRIGPYWVAEIADSEGNRLELTAPFRE